MFEKKHLWIWLAIPMLTLLQGIIALWDQLDNVPSSSGLGGVVFDLLILGPMLVVPVFVLSVVFRFLKVLPSVLKYVVLVLLIVSWLLINIESFVDYEAAWSTYAKEELWVVGVSISILPAMLASTLWLLLFYFIEKSWKT